MTTWVDPFFSVAVTSAGLIALAEVTDADTRGARVRIVRSFAGRERAGDLVTIRSSPIVGRGHEGGVLPRNTFLFIVRGAGGAAGYDAFTDSYWCFAISGGDRVHIPIRDPFTRVYVLHDDFAELVAAMRDPQVPRGPLLDRLVHRLTATPVAATQPIEVNDQIIALEALSHLGSERYAQPVVPFIASPHYQVRWSTARALGTCGGHDATQALFALLDTEDVPPIQAAIGEALFGIVEGTDARDAVKRAIPRMHAQAMPYSRNVMSPIMNMMPSPRDTLVAVLLKLRGEPGSLEQLRAIAASYDSIA